MILSLSLLFIGCKENTLNRIVYENEKYYEEGHFFKDSLFHGIVRIYNMDGRYTGYTNYSYGVENGVFVNKFSNGLTKDSGLIKNGLMENWAYKFDSVGHLVYKCYYYHGLHFGPNYLFRNGKIKKFWFLNLEAEEIYSLDYNKNDTLEYGDFPCYKMKLMEINGSKKVGIRLYLISTPETDIDYEIGIVKEKKILKSNKIFSDDFFYESNLDMPASGESYAIIANFTDTKTKVRKTNVYVIQ